MPRSTCTLGTERAFIGIDNEALADCLAGDEEFTNDSMAMKKNLGANDVLQVTYAMTEAELARFNEPMRTADAHRQGGRLVRAAADPHKAAAMLDTLDNFEPSKIAVLGTVVRKDVSNRGNALLARFDITAESKWEQSSVVLKIDPKKMARARQARAADRAA